MSSVVHPGRPRALVLPVPSRCADWSALPASASRRRDKTSSPRLSVEPLPSGFELPGIALSHSRQAGEADLVQALEAERKRIALDLHDGLGQSLTLIKLNAQNSSELLAAGAATQAQELLGSVVQRVNEAMREVRRACSELWPVMLDDLGLLPALSCVLREFGASCPGVVLDARVEVRESDVPKRLHAPIYRIFQEAMHNVVKHAGASRLAVRLRREGDAITLVIRDDGRGFDTNGRCLGGLGLAGMRQRACLSGGAYVLRSRRGRGTRISVCWPLQRAGRVS